MLEAVTLGETMVLMNPNEKGSLKYIFSYKKQVGGAESNFAIGLSRLGHQVGWISKLGADPHGEYIKSFVQGEGVDISQVRFSKQNPTGLYFKERSGAEESKAYYYRHGSAASELEPQELDEEYISQAKYLHLTGITPALSESCYQTILRAIEIAKQNNVTISFDPNLRLKLWPSKDKMREIMIDLISRADIVLPGKNEAEILFQVKDSEEMARKILELGAEIAVVKLGSPGALVATDKLVEKVAGYQVEQVVDPIGAGDGFAAGFIAGLLKGNNLVEAVKLANAVGAYAVTTSGDVEGLPSRQQIKEFTGEKEKIYR